MNKPVTEPVEVRFPYCICNRLTDVSGCPTCNEVPSRCNCLPIDESEPAAEPIDLEAILQGIDHLMAARRSCSEPSHQLALNALLAEVDRLRAAQSNSRSLLRVCWNGLRTLPEDSLGRDSEGWFYRDELIAQIEKAHPDFAIKENQ